MSGVNIAKGQGRRLVNEWRSPCLLAFPNNSGTRSFRESSKAKEAAARAAEKLAATSDRPDHQVIVQTLNGGDAIQKLTLAAKAVQHLQLQSHIKSTTSAPYSSFQSLNARICVFIPQIADNFAVHLSDKMSNEFPSAKPMFTMTLKIGFPIPIGSVSRGTPCTVVPLTGGKLLAERDSGFELDANLLGVGNDYIHYDPGGRHMRLDTHTVFRTLRDDRIYVKYTGIIEITPDLSAILGGSDHSKSTDFGNQFIHVQFETGSERYKELETGIFVGSGRFILQEDRSGLSAEYKISRIVHKTG